MPYRNDHDNRLDTPCALLQVRWLFQQENSLRHGAAPPTDNG